MRQFTKSVVKFLKAEDGPTAVEYAVMLALIIVVCIGAITTLGQNANTTFTGVAATLGGTGSGLAISPPNHPLVTLYGVLHHAPVHQECRQVPEG